MRRTHSGTLPLVMVLVMTAIMIVLYLMEEGRTMSSTMFEVGLLLPLMSRQKPETAADS